VVGQVDDGRAIRRLGAGDNRLDATILDHNGLPPDYPSLPRVEEPVRHEDGGHSRDGSYTFFGKNMFGAFARGYMDVYEGPAINFQTHVWNEIAGSS
jgi:hypothetical protein